ncbi:MAG TPA: chemotaxis protein CheA [Burkholderiales bacterium]
MSHTPDPGAQGGAFDVSQFLGVFFEETDEHLRTMESLLLDIDLANLDPETVNAIFRAAHSIKGNSGMFGLTDLADLTHEAETLLDRVRKGQMALSPAIVDTLLESKDALEALLARHRGEADAAPDTTPLVMRLRDLAAGRTPAATPEEATPAATPAPAAEEAYGLFDEEPADTPAEEEAYGLFADEPAPAAADEAYGLFDEAPAAAAPADTILTEAYGLFAGSAGAPPPAEPYGFFDGMPGAPRPAPYGFFKGMPGVPDSELAEDAPAARAATPAAAARAKTDKAAADAASIRVPVGKVDQLINLVGELVITQAMLAQNISGLDLATFQALQARMADLERNTRDLQESVMSIRMTPIAGVFNRFPRMLRDLAGKLNKKVNLKMIGEGTELDKGLIEKITDPMTHLVRNSLDHGIETPEARIAAGKPETGTITLSAFHRGGNIVIEVTDDGGGLKRDKILAKARSSGIALPANPTDAEVWNLIFEAGFSTAEVVSDVSGRGVGMDVVRRNIVALGGSVEIDSAAGVGTRMTVRLPLTLAIMDGMSLSVGGDIYIVPLNAVVESLQVDSQAIRAIGGAGRVIDMRGEYLPVLKLAEVFPPEHPSLHRGPEIIVIVEADGVKSALEVDELVGQQQVVVKSLETNFRRQPGIAGATIMGDGRVAMILDVASLIRKSRH